jgi:hypothetical protein
MRHDHLSDHRLAPPRPSTPGTLSQILVTKATASSHPEAAVRDKKPGWTVGMTSPTLAAVRARPLDFKGGGTPDPLTHSGRWWPGFRALRRVRADQRGVTRVE